MKIIIAGAGEVGSHLAKLLDQENHDITLMDNAKSRLSNIREYADVSTSVGSCTSVKSLRDSGVADADLFVGVTPEESTNITGCMLASKLGVKKTLARIDNYEYMLPENSAFFSQLGINAMIYPEYMAAREIACALETPWARVRWELLNNSVILSGVKVRENAPIVNKHLYEFSSENKKFHIVAIKRNMQTFIPRGSDMILCNDIIFFTTLKEDTHGLAELLGKRPFEPKNILFMGGSRITIRTTQLLPRNMNVKVIEQNQERAEKLVDLCPSNVTVLLGDARDTEFLQSEGIKNIDVFIALTGNSEANILGCLLAKQNGVKKTVAEVENIDYISMAEQMDIGTIINKKYLAASKIYELLLRADASNIKCLNFLDANVGEIVAKPNSKVTKKPIKALNLPSNITMGALVRNGHTMLVDGDTVIEAYDKVAIFFTKYSLNVIEKLFN